MTIVDDIKSRLDLLDEISNSVKLRRTGKNHSGLCPFHSEKTGSFIVFPGTQTWRCFGQCNTGGDIFEFVMKKEGWDFDTTLRYLAGKAGVELRAQSQEDRQVQELRRAREGVLGEAMRYFANELGAKGRLPKTQEAMNAGLEYALYQRMWTQETLVTAQTGYFANDWKGLREWLKTNGVDLESPAAVAFVGYHGDVEAWGRKWNVKPAAGWIEDKKIPAMPPKMLLYAHLVRGRVVYISGRKLEAEEGRPKSWNPPSELLGAKQVYFNQVWWGEKDAKQLVIVEGQADALTLGQWGIPAAALAGSAITAEEPSEQNDQKQTRTDNFLLSVLKQKLGKNARIVVGLDQDEAGKKASAKVVEALSAFGFSPMQIAVVEWPQKDANEWHQVVMRDQGSDSRNGHDLHAQIAHEAAALITGADSILEDLIGKAMPVNGRSDDEAVQKLFAELAKLTTFELERVRDDVCGRLNMRRRVFDALLRAARHDAGKGDDGQPAYFIEGGRVFARYFDARGGETVEALCNFAAEIQRDVLRDNGQDVIREFHIKGSIGKANLPLARVKAEDFSEMKWVLSAWGSRAIIEAGSRRRDQLRAALQHLSKQVEKKVVYTHTGWRETENGTGTKRIYLTSAGAVGGEAVEVELDRDLELYSIPTVAQDPATAMRLSLQFLDIAPDRIAFPLWGAMFLPPLRDLVNVAFALWVYGASGTMKSTYAALALNHYGPAFDDKHLPANFTDTANRLEQKSFVVKDAPLIIDDFAPQKDQRSYTEYTRTAHRIVRAAGNLAGRGRLTADSTARATYDPRSLVIITGEDLPESESLVARLFVVEVNRGDVDKAKLTALQGQREKLSHGMSGYLTWATECWTGWSETVPKLWRDYRQKAFEAGYHLRLPEAVAGLMIGIELGMRYAQTLGVISPADCAQQKERAWAALQEGAKAMSSRVKEEKPETLFIRTISDLITQGKIFLKSSDAIREPLGGPADRSEMMGWYDADRLYLLPEAVYNRVSRHFRDQGNVFPVREVTLRKMLAEGGILETEPGRRTLAVSLDGQTRRVMVVKRSYLLEKDDEEKKS